jgi:hypothetical protein
MTTVIDCCMRVDSFAHAGNPETHRRAARDDPGTILIRDHSDFI